MGSTLRIAVIAGDGIGREVMPWGVRLLEELARELALPLELWPLELGAERWLRDGSGLDAGLFAEIRSSCRAVLLGALGDPRVPGNEHARQILFGLRQGLDLYANVRPARALADRVVPLAGRRKEDVDIVVVRENTEGLYAGVGHQSERGTARERAVEEDVNTRAGVERVLRFAFDRARREGRRLCMTDKSNALRHAHELWQRVFALVREEYPDVEAEHVYVDALCHDLVRDPRRFSLIVAPNLLGDIVSDLSAALAGGLGLAPSASLHPGADVPGLFEPVHGSAPALVGRGLANPFAMLQSVGMLLAELGQPDARARIEAACAAALEAGEATPDVGGRLDTDAAAEGVLRRLRHGTFSKVDGSSGPPEGRPPQPK